VNPLAIALPGTSAMPVPALLRSSRSVPSPLRLFTVTVQVQPPVGVTDAIPRQAHRSQQFAQGLCARSIGEQCVEKNQVLIN
jgi:hypothetical protein